MKQIKQTEMTKIIGGSWSLQTIGSCWLSGAAVAVSTVALGPGAAVAGTLTYAACMVYNY